MLKNKDSIKIWLNEMGIEHYTINEDLTVDVDGDVFISNDIIGHIPVQFGLIKGDFFLNNNEKLTSLKGSPIKVMGNFACDHNALTSLKYSPVFVQSSFYCNHNQLSSLKHCPNHVGEHIQTQNNPLETLEYFPKKLGAKLIYKGNVIPYYENIADANGYISIELGILEAKLKEIKTHRKFNQRLQNKLKDIPVKKGIRVKL